MNVNQKGCIGLTRVIADLYRRGHQCFLPFDDYSPIDLIVMTSDKKLLRLQVKYREKSKRDNNYSLPTVSVVNGIRIPIDRGLIDGWALFMADDDRVEYIPVSDLDGIKTKCIRSEHTWNWIT